MHPSAATSPSSIKVHDIIRRGKLESIRSMHRAQVDTSGKRSRLTAVSPLMTALVIVSSALVTSCFGPTQAIQPGDSTGFSHSGRVVISHQIIRAPGQTAGRGSTQKASLPVSGFAPTDMIDGTVRVDTVRVNTTTQQSSGRAFVPAINERWMMIDRESQTISVFEGDSQKIEGRLDTSPDGVAGPYAGLYMVLDSAESQRWYAPDSYFTARRLNVPATNDPIRFRRGALGPRSILLSQNVQIHSGKIASAEVGGIRAPKELFEQISRYVERGMQIIIK